MALAGRDRPHRSLRLLGQLNHPVRFRSTLHRQRDPCPDRRHRAGHPVRVPISSGRFLYVPDCPVPNYISAE